MRIATDNTEYFRQVLRLVSELSFFAVISDAGSARPKSKFEGQFTQQGVAIHRLVLRKVSPVT
jgi:tRNA G46 methylase TrmB